MIEKTKERKARVPFSLLDNSVNFFENERAESRTDEREKK